MYPSLNPVRNGTRWYARKQTQQEKLEEMSFFEEKLAEKRLEEIQVTAPIWIDGEYVVPARIMEKNEKNEEYNEDDLFNDRNERLSISEPRHDDDYNDDMNDDLFPSHIYSNELYTDTYESSYREEYDNEPEFDPPPEGQY